MNENRNLENVVISQQPEAITGEWVDSFRKDACNPSRKKPLSSKDLAGMQEYIKNFSVSNVYTHSISSKEHITENVRKAMTQTVKMSAYVNFFDPDYNKKDGENDGKFVNQDQEIFNFAKSKVFKNASSKRPAVLNESLASYMKSIGQIACGNIQGTCFLVTDELVLTNYHIYRMIEQERNERNLNLPIEVKFNYFYPEPTELFTVEVDEQDDPNIESEHVDYKFFRLRHDEGLSGRASLGPMVRIQRSPEGRVVILGHPEGKEMQEEICIVISSWRERIKDRHELCNGVHMTNEQLLHKYQGSLPYDSTFFCGSSGSPVFDMNGNIVAMHTQGYLLERKEANAPNQQQDNLSNQDEENVSRTGNSRIYSLMEFGVQFLSICTHMTQEYGKTVVQNIFPNYTLSLGEEPMAQ